MRKMPDSCSIRLSEFMSSPASLMRSSPRRSMVSAHERARWNKENKIRFNTILDIAIQYNVIHYNLRYCNTLKYYIIQYIIKTFWNQINNIIQYNWRYCNTIQCNTIQLKILKYNEIPYNTIYWITMLCNKINS